MNKLFLSLVLVFIVTLFAAILTYYCYTLLHLYFWSFLIGIIVLGLLIGTAGTIIIEKAKLGEMFTPSERMDPDLGRLIFGISFIAPIILFILFETGLFYYTHTFDIRPTDFFGKGMGFIDVMGGFILTMVILLIPYVISFGVGLLLTGHFFDTRYNKRIFPPT